MEQVAVHTESIRLDQFLKLAGAVMTGGEVKWLIFEKRVLLNGQEETARRRQLHAGDVVTLRTDGGNQTYRVTRGE